MHPDPLIQRIAAQQDLARARARALTAEAARIAERLRARGATRVVLFGSLATGAMPHAETDVDLCVFGLDEVAFGEMVIEIMETAAGPVDLVRGETASPRLMRALARDGREI
jgi:predicted nucleotidyltransferase